MGYADLIYRLQGLPEDKQTEVFDFVEFLAQRHQAAASPLTVPLAQTPFARWIKNPTVIPHFQPFSREEANAR